MNAYCIVCGHIREVGIECASGWESGNVFVCKFCRDASQEAGVRGPCDERCDGCGAAGLNDARVDVMLKRTAEEP